MPPPEELADQIDPTWWAAPFAADVEHDVDEFPELLARSFESVLRTPGLSELRQRVLTVLAKATSAILVPENWLAPFDPAISMDGQRSVIPSDLDRGEIELLALIAPLIEQPVLQARVADVAWFYGDRRRVELLDLAVDAYRSAPPDGHDWLRKGQVSWRRAIELAQRRGPAGQRQRDEMCEALQKAILSNAAGDGPALVAASEMLRRSFKVKGKTVRKLAEQLSGVASGAFSEQPRLARRLQREAAAWFSACSDAGAAQDCIARVVDTYIAEADQRVDAGPSAALAAGHFLEKAISTIRELPRQYRDAHGLEARLGELRRRLGESRETSLEQMVRLRSESIDLAEHIQFARARVAGKSPFEALTLLSVIHPLIDAEQAHATAEKHLAGSIVHLLGRSTFAQDGRKVAASPGARPGVTDPDAIRAEVVRSFGTRSDMIGMAFICRPKTWLPRKMSTPSNT